MCFENRGALKRKQTFLGGDFGGRGVASGNNKNKMRAIFYDLEQSLKLFVREGFGLKNGLEYA